MKRPNSENSHHVKNWRIAGLVLVLPLLLMGLLTMPNQGPRGLEKKNGVVNVDALVKKVKSLNRHHKHQESMDLLIAALEGQPEDSLLRPLLLQTFDLFLEGEVHAGQKDIKSNNRNVSAYIRVAGALELMDNNYQAMEVLVNGISVNPDAPELWMKIGKLELKAKRDWEALDVFKEVIREDAKNSDAYNNAAFILARSQKCRDKDLKDAQKFALNARKLDPNNAEYLDTMAELEFRQGHQAQAQKLIKEAIKLAPDKDFFKTQLKRFSQK